MKRRNTAARGSRRRARRDCRQRPRGFTLVEISIAIVLISGILLAALDSVAAVAATRKSTADRAAAAARAHELASEILSLPFFDPQTNSATIGPGMGESGATRQNFDNAADYHGWTGAPQTKSGTPITLFRSAAEGVIVIERLSRAHGPELGGSARVHEITITITRGSDVMYRLTVLKTS
jgi:prepilin-type N-terminal cleavage/methylation domain-containing protein